MSTKVNTPEFRIAFPALFTPKKNDLNGKDEYSCVALFKKGEDLAKLKAAAQEALEKKFGSDKNKWPKNLRSPFRDQGDRAKENDAGDMVLPQGYEDGAIYLNLRSQQRPGVVDNQVQAILDSSEVYGGCWCIASINAYAYDMKGNRGVSFGLGNIQKIRDDEAFGNRSKAEDDFAPVEGAGDAAGNESSSTDLFS